MPKKSVFLTDQAEAIVGADSSFSGRLNYLLELTDEAIQQATPEMPIHHWLAVIDALNGHFHAYNEGWANVLSSAWQSVADAAPESEEKWAADGAAIARELAALPIIQQAAVLEVVRRYWTLDKKQFDSHGQMLESAGARLK